MTKTKDITPLELAHATRISHGLKTRKAVIDSLRSATQPVTIGEVQQYLEKKRGMKRHSTYIRNILIAAESEGLAFSREETEAEQLARGGTRRLSILFWAGGRKMPVRTSKEAYAGITSKPLTDIVNNNKKKKAKKTVRPGKALVPQTDKVNFLVQSKSFSIPRSESLETYELKIRVAELESQLSAIRNLLS